MAGFCNVCHRSIEGDNYKFVKGRKVCLSCFEKMQQDKQKQLDEARQLEKEKEELYAFLLSFFALREIPNSWENAIISMLKKGYTCRGIINTIQYCNSIGKGIVNDNWSALVYIYYEEAQKDKQEKQRIIEINNQKTISKKVVSVKIHDTTYRDLPPFNIEDL